MEISNKTKTIAASTAAAVLIAGGVAIYNNSNSSDIDWSMYDLNIPELNIPALNIPELNIPELNIPEMDILNANTSDVNAIDLNAAITDQIILIIPLININELNEGNLNIEKLSDNTEDLQEWMDFIKDVNNTFIDKRNVQRDELFKKPNALAKEWIAVYKEYKTANDVKFIPIIEKFRMITEVKIPKNTEQLDILKANLIFYKSEGYDSVLVTFNKNDSSSDILNTIKYIKKNCDMKVWAAYSGDETLNESVFMNVNKYKEILTEIAPYLNGYINSWRRTSVHLWKQDEEFMKLTNTTLRKANPNLPIIAELYFGNSYKYDSDRNVGFETNSFKNCSAIMIVNFGYRLIDFNYLFNTVLNKYIKDVPKVGCVVGHKPHYLTTNKNNLSFKENLNIKHEIENKFYNQGCIGTVTLSNDGNDSKTNNLSEKLYTTF